MCLMSSCAMNHYPPPVPASAQDSQGHQAASHHPQSHPATLCLSFSSESFSCHRETDDVLSWKCKKHYMHDSLVLIVNSNSGHACPAPMPRVWAWASDSGLERSNLAGIWHPGAESGEVLFSACPSAILPWACLLEVGWLDANLDWFA